MLLTIRTTHTPADDLGWLLHKHPAKVQDFDLGFGRAHVFYPELADHACTAALLLEIDPIRLVRGGPTAQAEALLSQYVNDRPYVASSFLSVAIAQVLRSALAGICKERPELPTLPLPLTARLPCVPCRGGETFLRKLFEPLGYTVTAERLALDTTEADEHSWGMAPYWSIEISRTTPLRELLTHLCVLLPVLDDDKHDYIGDEEVDKLLRFGDGWLADHPEREAIATRYLKHRTGLTRTALARLTEGDSETDAVTREEAQLARDHAETNLERPMNLNDERLHAVVEFLRTAEVNTILDLGCGEGKLLARLLKHKQFTRIVGVEVAHLSLERAQRRLHLDDMPELQRARIELLHGSLVYRDRRLDGFDAAACIEVIEHIDPSRLPAFERALFVGARPGLVLISTPNSEYNQRSEHLPADAMRHSDHHFESTRAQFNDWAQAVAARNGYTVEFTMIGPTDPELGAPTQMGVFRRCP